MTEVRRGSRPEGVGEDPLWYKDAIIYELHVRAFFDGTGDGKGDFRGLTAKLDYLRDLGVTAIWLLPFYPSPGKDDGYDIADYTSVNPDYGSLRDVRTFIREAHRRGLRVITELVCNHTSDQHPWFQRARHAPPGSVWRDFYVWSDTPDRYREARIIFKDFETSNWTWDPVANAYYWHRFYHHQPDLNFESPHVRQALFKAMDFWLEMGVDGLRLDAIPYLYERDGTNCENLPETHAFLRELRRRIDERYGDRMLLAEANQWPEDSVAYFGDGDECHMSFHFPVMPRLFMSIRMEDRFPIVDILSQTPPIPESAQWALFLRNHDELTLEMVTDEERDYMYRVYAHDPQMRINLGIRRRLAPLLGNNRRRIELMNGLLFSLPGTPVLYYGDEIGMGDNVYLGDRNGVRTPMQWSGDRNAGFSDANRQRLYLPVITDPEYHYESINVEAQQANPNSLLWWTKRLMALRKRHPAFSRGTTEFLHPENRKVLVFIREHEGERLLVVANLSRFVQYVELDLSAYAGSVPVEMFGQAEFPPVGERPFFVTIGPHGFYWFVLQPPRTAISAGGEGDARPDAHVEPVLTGVGALGDLLGGRAGAALLRLLPDYLRGRRWFGGKARRIRDVQLLDPVPIAIDGVEAAIAVLQVDYREGEPDTYVLPLALADDEEAERIVREAPQALVARVEGPGDHSRRVLYDALYDRRFDAALLDLMAGRGRLRGSRGQVQAEATPALRGLRGKGPLDPAPVRTEQSNTSVIFGDRLILKLFRRLEPGTNPDLEIGRALTDAAFAQTPPVAGFIVYRPERGDAMALGILQGFVPNEGDAWAYTLDAVGGYYERAIAMADAVEVPATTTRGLLELAATEPPDEARAAIGTFLDAAEQLGRRTAELHRALAGIGDAAFAPEPFTPLYQRSLYQGMRTQARESLALLAGRRTALAPEAGELADAVMAAESTMQERYRRLIERALDARRIRIHGDYHAGQVLYTGRDFVIIDFEGEPGRPMTERRHKHSPLRDVAGMLRSFHYAAFGSLQNPTLGGTVRLEDVERLEPWATFWYGWVAGSFLRGYLGAIEGSGLLPSETDDIALLLDALVLQKAVYELAYELNNRPDWVSIPLRGILDLVDGPQPAPTGGTSGAAPGSGRAGAG
jgi:maltose alpha-D-glucosyltransferase / alpha-amylase